MNRYIPLLALALCFPLTARADEASKRAKAEEFITLLHLDTAVNQLLNTIMDQTTTITVQKAGGTLTPELQASLDGFQKKLVAVIEPQIGWNAVKAEYIGLYADGFTEQELDSLLVFYKSPAGKALLEKLPELNQQGGKLLQTKFVAIQPQLKQMLADYESSVGPKPVTPPTLSPLAPAPAKSTPK